MGKKGIEDMINEIEIFIDSCKFQPLSSNKIVVPKDEIQSMLQELKLKMPGEIERCQKIMRNKDAILADARNRSDQIISDANEEAKKLVDESEIVATANEQAAIIIENANNEALTTVNNAKASAEQIMAVANNDATEIRTGSMYYTQDTLTNIQSYICKTLEEINLSHSQLVNTLQSSLQVVDTNKGEIDAQINEITGANNNSSVSSTDEKSDVDYLELDDDDDQEDE